VDFTSGAVHEPVVVGQLYDDDAAPQRAAGNPPLTAISMPVSDQLVVDDPPSHDQGHGQGQGHGHSDKAHPGDPPPSRHP
jgi:hypothetical protein